MSRRTSSTLAWLGLIGALSCVAASGPAFPASMSVRVTDGRGAPVPRARISVWRLTEHTAEKLSSGTADAAGRASLDAPAGVKLRVLAVAPGWCRGEADLEGPAPSLTIRLNRGGAVELRVRDRTSGRPVTRFSVLAAPAGAGAAAAGRLAYTLETLDVAEFESAEGVGRLTGLGSAPTTLVVRAERYPVAVVPLAADRGAPLLVDLDDTGCVERRIVDSETSAPVEAAVAVAEVEQLAPELLRLAGPPRSGPDGAMWLCPSPPDVQTLLLVHADYAPRQIAPPPVDSPRGGFEVIPLTRGGAVEGLVRMADGAPLSGAVVRTFSLGVPRRAVSGPDGHFRIDRLAAGPASIELVDARGAVAERRAAVIRENQVTEADFTAGDRVLVRVERDGRPAADQTLVILAPGADEPLAAGFFGNTDAEGAILVPAAALAGRRTVFAVRDGNSIVFAPPPERAAPPPAAPPTLQLEGRWTAGVVRAADGAGAIAGARVSCARGSTALRQSSAKGPLWLPALGATVVADSALSLAASDASGRFRFWLPSWCQKVHVVGPAVHGENRPWRTARMSPSAFPADSTAEIRLERGPLVLVSAEGSGGLELRDAEVRLHRPGVGAALISVPLVGGVSRIEPDDEGPFVILVRAKGWAPALAGPLVPLDGPPTRVDVTLEGEVWLRLVERRPAFETGTLLDAFRAARLSVLDAAGRDWAPFLDARPDGGAGALVLGPAPPGRYTVVAGDVRRTVTIRSPGETADVEFAP